MREIKFRGRDTDGNWHYGDLLRYVRDSYDMIIPDGYANSDNLYDDVVSVDYETVGQFTGLKDSTGKEIYEGDIIKTQESEIGIIVWENDLGGFRARLADNSFYTLTALFASMFSVIGNVYDNPELLEAQA